MHPQYFNLFFNPPRPTGIVQKQSAPGYAAHTQSSSQGSSTGVEDYNLPDIHAERRLCPILAEHTKPFIDEFKNRARYNRTWPDVKVHLAVMEVPTQHYPSHFNASSSQMLNPHAASFISSSGPMAHLLQPVVPQSQQPTWLIAFYAATNFAAAPRHMNEYASAILDYRTWTSESIAELAQHFCWRGAEGMTRGVATAATFARTIHSRFGSVHGVWYANEFMLRLGETVFRAFKAVWKSARPTQTITMAYVSSALSLATFIGDLFARNLFPVSQVHACLSFLLAEATTIEHVHAIHLLLMHANKGAWNAHAVLEFVAALARRVGYLDGRAEFRTSVHVSLVDREIEEYEVGVWIAEIMEMVQRWG